jgi:hypothetical protein
VPEGIAEALFQGVETPAPSGIFPGSTGWEKGLFSSKAREKHIAGAKAWFILLPLRHD